MFSIFFQIPIASQVDQAASVAQAQTFFSNPLVILAIVLFALGVLFVIALFTARHFARKGKSLPKEFHKRILRILVPKESLQQDQGAGNDTQQSIREDISVAETFFASIGGMKPHKGFSAWWYGREDSISFEIVAEDEEISFYVAVPLYLLKFVEQQIQAQFPEAHIEEVDDYNIFQPQGFILGTNLKFEKESYFPIKTYQEVESDPLNSLTTPLSQLKADEGATIQIVVRSAHPSWHKMGSKIASSMRQGKKLSDAKKDVNGGLGKFFSEFSKAVSTKTDQPGADKHYQLSPLEEEMIKGLETKSSKAGVEANIRIMVSSPTEQQAQLHLDSIIGAFSQFNIYEYGNSFKESKPSKQHKLIEDYIFRNFDGKNTIILNTEEMASLYHFPLPQTETTNIKWLTAKRAPAPLNVPEEGILLGYNNYRNKKVPIRMKRADRRRHQYMIGKSGSGKSVLLAQMAKQDIANGEGVCVIDPHGDLVDDVLAGVPKDRVEDVIIFDPSDVAYPLGMNLLEFDPDYPEQKTFVINEMLKIFDKLYDLKSTGGPMFEQYVRNAMLLIMADPESGSTLMEISKVLADDDFRKYKLSKCTNQIVVDFWVKEAEKAGGDAALANMVPYITSKLNQFVANDIMRPIIGQQKSAFNLREVMDSKKILLVKLSKGKIGELNSHLLGMVIVGKILMAALSRTDVPQADRKDFYLYIDEFQNFTTDSIAIILSEARKYMLNLIIAHQYIGQLVEGGDTEIKDAVFGNAGTIVAYKVGTEDTETLAKEFAPVFNEYDLLNVEQYSVYIKLLANNQSLRPFSMQIPPPEEGHGKEITDAMTELSRLKYGRPRAEVEEEIKERTQVAEPPPKPERPKSPFDML